MKVFNPTLKALGALLTYPDEVLVAAVPELRAILEGEPAELRHNPEVKRAYLGKGGGETAVEEPAAT